MEQQGNESQVAVGASNNEGVEPEKPLLGMTSKDEIIFSNTLTTCNALLDHLLPIEARRRLEEKIDNDHLLRSHKHTRILDAVALLLTRGSEVTAVAASLHNTRGDILTANGSFSTPPLLSADAPQGGSPKVDEYITSQNIHPDSDPKSFRLLHKHTPSDPITDFESLLKYFKGPFKKKSISFEDHSSMLANLLSSPETISTGFNAKRLPFFVLASCADKIQLKLKQFIGPCKSWLESKKVEDAWEDLAYTCPPQTDIDKAFSFKKVISKDDSNEVANLKKQLGSFSSANQFFTKNPNDFRSLYLLCAYSKDFYDPKNPFVLHLTLVQTITAYWKCMKGLQELMHKLATKTEYEETSDGKLKPNLLLNFENRLENALLLGSAADILVRSKLLPLYLNSFSDLPDLWTQSRIGNAPRAPGHDVGNADKDPKGDDAKDGSGDGEDGDEILAEEYGAPRTEPTSRTEQFMKLFRLTVAHLDSVDVVGKYVSKCKEGAPDFKIRVSTVSPPTPNAGLMPLDTCISQAYQLVAQASTTGGTVPRVDPQLPTKAANLLRSEAGKMAAESKAGALWTDIKSGTSRNMKLHCETNLGIMLFCPCCLSETDRKTLNERFNRIHLMFGVSKRCCPACGKCLEYMHEAFGEGSGHPFQVQGIHSSWFQWALPEDLPQSVKTKLLIFFSRVLVDRLKSLQDSVDPGTKHSPHSSPGSEPEALEEEREWSSLLEFSPEPEP